MAWSDGHINHREKWKILSWYEKTEQCFQPHQPPSASWPPSEMMGELVTEGRWSFTSIGSWHNGELRGLGLGLILFLLQLSGLHLFPELLLELLLSELPQLFGIRVFSGASGSAAVQEVEFKETKWRENHASTRWAHCTWSHPLCSQEQEHQECELLNSRGFGAGRWVWDWRTGLFLPLVRLGIVWFGPGLWEESAAHRGRRFRICRLFK